MDQMNKIFRASGLIVELALFYVDDVRFILRGFARGFHWDKTKIAVTLSTFTFSRVIWIRGTGGKAYILLGHWRTENASRLSASLSGRKLK